MVGTFDCSVAGLSSKRKGQSSACAPIFSSTNLHLSEQYTPLKWITWVYALCFIERRAKKRSLWFSLRGKERADYLPSLLNKIAKQKHSLSPCYKTTHPAPAQVFCNLGPPAQLLCQVPLHAGLALPARLPPAAISQQWDRKSTGLDD